MGFTAKAPTMLEKLQQEWVERGWETSDLRRFRMEDPPKDPPPPPPPPPKDPPKDPDKKFDQDEVSRMMTREKREGKEAAERKMAEDLGMSLTEAKALIKSQKDAADAKKTDQERALEATTKERDDAKAEANEAKAEAFVSKLEAKLLRAGCKPEKIDKATKLIDVSYGDDDDKVTDAIKSFQEDESEWFTTTEGSEQDPKGPPGQRLPKQPRPSGKSVDDIVKDRLNKRHPNRVTSDK